MSEVDEKRAAPTAGQRLGVDPARAAELRDLVRRQQRTGRCGKTGVPGRQRLERLLRLRTVPYLRVQRIQRQSPARRSLVPLVRIGQAAQRDALVVADPGRQQVEDSIEHFDRHGAARCLESRAAHQPQSCRERPLVLKDQAARRVLLAKAQAGSRQVLPHRARPGVDVGTLRERLPQLRAATAVADPGAWTGVLPAHVDLVHGLVGKERAVAILAAGGEGACGGNEGPEVAVTGECDEERRALVVAVDPVPRIPVRLYKRSAIMLLVQAVTSSSSIARWEAYYPGGAQAVIANCSRHPCARRRRHRADIAKGRSRSTAGMQKDRTRVRSFWLLPGGQEQPSSVRGSPSGDPRSVITSRNTRCR